MKKGIFWCTDYLSDPPIFIIVGVDCDVRGNAISESVHFSSKSGNNFNHRAEWAKIDKGVTSGKPFNYYPRGRVEIRNNRATIYMNPVLNNGRTVHEIKRLFGLTGEQGLRTIRVISGGSRHYQFEDQVLRYDKEYGAVVVPKEMKDFWDEL